MWRAGPAQSPGSKSNTVLLEGLCGGKGEQREGWGPRCHSQLSLESLHLSHKLTCHIMLDTRLLSGAKDGGHEAHWATQGLAGHNGSSMPPLATKGGPASLSHFSTVEGSKGSLFRV